MAEYNSIYTQYFEARNIGSFQVMVQETYPIYCDSKRR